MAPTLPVIPLKNIFLLSDLSEAQIAEFEQLVGIQNFERNEYILHAGDDTGKIFIVRSGLVQVRLPVESIADKSVLQCAALLSVESMGTVLGEVNLLNGQGHTAHVVALTKTTCWWLSSVRFEQFCDSHPLVWKNIARITTVRLQQKNELVSLLSLHDNARLIASILLDISEKFKDVATTSSGQLCCVLTQDEIALMCGLSRRTVSKVIVNLITRGIIRLLPGRHLIIISDPTQLRHIRQGKRLNS